MIELKSVKSKNPKRLGRGISAGGGKTAGRGTKGQKSRAGHNIPKRHEGGQTPLSMRLPKLPGFKSNRKKTDVITLTDISNHFKDGEIVSIETLIEKNIIGKNQPVKILNNGELTVKVTLLDVNVSKSAEGLFGKPESKEIPAQKKTSKSK